MDRRIRRVGVRQLRQNLSVYLRKVKAGQTLEVTERGQAVAVLAPIPGPSTALQRLIAEGRVIPAQGDLLALGPPPGPVSTWASETLEETREDRL